MSVIRFYPDNSKDPKIFPAKPFGFGSERLDSGFPLLLSTNDASPHQFHLSMPVKPPVSNLTMYAIIRAKKHKSSRKCFNKSLIFNNLQALPVENRVCRLWIKLWKIEQVFTMHKLTFLQQISTGRSPVEKKNNSSKNIFFTNISQLIQ